MKDFEFSYTTGGVSLKYKDVTIIRKSSLYVVSPGWTRLLFGHHQAEHKITCEDIPDGKVVRISMGNEFFSATYHVTMKDSNEVTIDLAYQLVQDVPAEIEYCVGYIPAQLIAGFPYEAETEEGQRSGFVPYTAKSADHFESMLVPPFKRLEFETRPADIEISVSGDCSGLIIFDARRDPQVWAREAPIFWCGMGHPPEKIVYGKEYHVVTNFKFVPRQVQECFELNPTSVEIKTVKNAKLPKEDLIKIIPEPKYVEYSERDFIIEDNVAIVLPDNPTSDDRLNAEILNEELNDIYGVTLPVTTPSKMKPGTKIIGIGEPARNSTVAYLCKETGLEVPNYDEGYALKSCSQFVVIAGKDTRGTFYGVQTLLQLLKPTVDGAAVHGAIVRDWPTMKIRGAHIFMGGQGKPFIKKLIRRIFARHKMNYLIFQTDYVKWESHPEIWVSYGASKADVKEVVEYAKMHHMEVVPLVQSLGHSEWMFANNSNLNLAEDPEHPYGYCPSKPESYKFLFDIYNEAIEVFKPKVFHIGHDEITMRGRFPRDELCSKKTISQLFLEDVEKLRAYLAERGIRTMLWGDMMLHSSETPCAGMAESLEAAKERREALPKDIIIADWHYCTSEDFPSVRLFKEKGHEVLACTWYNPYNIYDFSRSAKKDGAEGLIQTLWSGFNVDERCLDQQFHQYHAFILAAEYAWNTGETSVSDLPYFSGEEFLKLWRREKADHSASDGFVVNLSPFANIMLSSDNESAWIGYGPDHDLRELKTGNIRLCGIGFEIPQNKALMFSGAMNPKGSWPCEIRIPLSRTADSVAFLIATGWVAEKGTPVGKIVFRYSNTESMVLDLVYGKNIAAWNDHGSIPYATVAWRGKTRAGEIIALRILQWNNPYPKRPIQAIEILSNNTEACPIVFAITGIGG